MDSKAIALKWTDELCVEWRRFGVTTTDQSKGQIVYYMRQAVKEAVEEQKKEHMRAEQAMQEMSKPEVPGPRPTRPPKKGAKGKK